MENGDILVLENLRFYSEEKRGDKEFAKKLANLADVYVNDSFGTAHRAHASTAIIAEYFPNDKYFGFLLSGEVNSLEKALSTPKRPFTAIIGGAKITDKIGGTTIHNILLDRYANEKGFVIAGTSAGAMCMANEMIAGGSATEAFIKGAVTMYKGLELIPELIVDTHFIKRGRFGRQSEAIAKFPNLVGIGLAEDTGMIIKNGTNCTVIGSGMVIVFDGNTLTHNNEKLLKEGTPMTMANMIVHVLSNGDQYDIKNRKVTVLPIEAPFI